MFHRPFICHQGSCQVSITGCCILLYVISILFFIIIFFCELHQFINTFRMVNSTQLHFYSWISGSGSAPGTLFPGRRMFVFLFMKILSKMFQEMLNIKEINLFVSGVYPIFNAILCTLGRFPVVDFGLAH